MNSVYYRFIEIEPSSNSSLGMSGIFVERFGNYNNSDAPFQLNFPLAYQCDSLGGVYEWYWWNFKCFEDDSFTLYNPSGEDCEWWLNNVGTEDNSIDFAIHPNPADDILFITIPKGEYEVRILDTKGTTVGNLFLVLRQLT